MGRWPWSPSEEMMQPCLISAYLEQTVRNQRDEHGMQVE